MQKRELLKLTISALFLVLAGAGCGTLTIPQYTAGPSTQAKTVESQGLKITVDPILDAERGNTYFKVDPANSRVDIIYLQAENASTNSTWLLNEANMHLVVTGQADLNAQDQDVKGHYGTANGLAGRICLHCRLYFPVQSLVRMPQSFRRIL